MKHAGRADKPWICAQLGSRDHYAIPRALHRSGNLRAMLTDFWAGGRPRAGSPGFPAWGKAAQRFHPDLANAPVWHLGPQRIAIEMLIRLARQRGWAGTMRRNAWFQRTMLRRLRRAATDPAGAPTGIFFGYSYAALELMSFFRTRGWKIVLGQIDPGPREEQLVAAEHARCPASGSCWRPAPGSYWREWRRECDGADRIVANSEWSREALVESGIAPAKIRLIPLAFEPDPSRPAAGARRYPEAFGRDRPMRVLFLGQIGLRKGAHLAFEAARRLASAPIAWTFAGPSELPPPEDLLRHPHFRWLGPVPRNAAAELYREADLFLLPTLSDGFALTQLEAQAERLPVLASRFCGAVVRPGQNGAIVDPLSVEKLVEVLGQGAENPHLLSAWSEASGIEACHRLEALEENLRELALELA